ncbi:hypothetical protein [Clavibacter michiganensis]|uniref:hypothetical protein n=1 Tax=Clavibacter michiganensis TaxID=28447 RepID=UPI001BE0020A|nr:hypothetical protein [Clavibacter michiganensis]MBT1636455.1 hypothetical protein [Clavibacter michiganensis]
MTPRIRALILTGIITGLTAAIVAAARPWTRPPEPDDWVVLRFAAGADGSAYEAFASLATTEAAGDDALQLLEAGAIDGNAFGDDSYDVHYAGSDRRLMWEVLEPIFQDAPVAWTSVELRRGFDDAAPVVVRARR